MRKLLYGENWWQILALPLRVFLSGRDDNPQYFDGVLNPMLVLFLPWAFTGKWLSEKRILFAFALLYFFYALFLVDLRIRYLLPAIPPLVILLVYGIHNVYLRMRRPPLLFAVMILLVALNGIYLWNYSHSVSPLEYVRGRESRDSYLARMLPEYPAIQYINQKLSSTAKIYFIFVGRRVYYSERDYFHDWSDNPRFLLKAIRGAGNGREIQAALQQKGITHLLVQYDLFRRFLTNNLTSRELQVWEQFHERYLRALFGLRGYGLYEIVI